MQTLNFSILEGFLSHSDDSSEDKKERGGGEHYVSDAEEKLKEIFFICQQDHCPLVLL